MKKFYSTVSLNAISYHSWRTENQCCRLRLSHTYVYQIELKTEMFFHMFGMSNIAASCKLKKKNTSETHVFLVFAFRNLSFFVFEMFSEVNFFK